MDIKVFSSAEVAKTISDLQWKRDYFAMYSSVLGGIVTDPQWMLLPIDDHMVHRGDGVFEAIKVVHGQAYLLNEHMDRLQSSATALGLKPFVSFEHMREIVTSTWAATQKITSQSQAILRVFLSRGGGNFSTNPYDTVGSQFFVVVTRLTALPSAKYENGVKAKISQVPVKSPWLATIKTCNYLPNVMMKKEAVDAGVDYTVSLDSAGCLAESSTENMTIVTKDGYLVKPQLKEILRGCTMTRVFELAVSLCMQGKLKGIESRPITREDLAGAREMMMLGTTLDVLPVTEFEATAVGSGRPGGIAIALQELLLKDQAPAGL